MAYKINNKGNNDGSYTLSYGKSSKKLTAKMQKIDGGQWAVETPAGWDFTSRTMKETKASWGAWAEQNYDQGSSSPTPPASSGPPSFKPPVFSAPKPALPEQFAEVVRDDDGRTDVDNKDACNPFDAAFFTREDGQTKLTPLGALDEVYNWMHRNSHHVLYRNNSGDFLKPPFDNVLRVLIRCCPDKDYKPIAGTSEPTPKFAPPPAAAPPKFAPPASTPLTPKILQDILAKPNPGVTPGTEYEEDDIPF